VREMALSIRDAYGAALVKYGKDNADVVVLDADVSSSTKSGLFGRECPDRFFNVGIAEANMNAMACGFASAGKIPFTNTFATFTTSNGLLSMRALASYNNLNVKFIGAYGGLSDSYDGPTHHSIDDLAVTMALPNFTVAVASDEVVTDFLVRSAIETKGPFYIRLSREALPKLYEESGEFTLGRAKRILNGKDVTVIACGVMVSQAVNAAELLREAGLDVGVVDMFTVKPLDVDAVIEAARRSGALVVAEEHNRYGGLCASVCQALVAAGECVPVEFVTLNDEHTESGAYDALLARYGLDDIAVAEACKKAIAGK